jgi:L-amino acid N-acyltransferase
VATSHRKTSVRLDPTIRRALLDDAEAMRAIYNEAVRTTTATFDTTPRTHAEQLAWFQHHDARHVVLAAELEGQVVGWASLSPWSERRAYDGTAESSVYVGTPWRNRGVGQALVSEILTAARSSKFHVILARIAEGNPASRALHISAGFSTVGVMHEVGHKFGRLLDVELMELRLSSSPNAAAGQPP